MTLFHILFTYILPFFIFIVVTFCLILYITTQPYPQITRYHEEKYYTNKRTGKKEEFPSLEDKWTVNLSIIVPAYNEEERLPPMLDSCINFMEQRAKSGLTYEIIIVSDGSTDKTVEVAHKYAAKYETVKVLALVKNRGKGGAVRLGSQSARGSAILFADADGATTFSDLDKLDVSLKSILGCDYNSDPEKIATNHGIVCGSRAHLEEEEKAQRSLFRLFLMHGFHFLVWLLCVRGVRDTQCGFKLLTRESARIVFSALHVERWAFDVEMLYIGQKLGMPITEVAVEWQEIEGSKVVPFWSWLEMGRDLCLIWLRYRIGAWRIAKDKRN